MADLAEYCGLNHVVNNSNSIVFRRHLMFVCDIHYSMKVP